MTEIAVLIPCYNEVMTIGDVIQGFQNQIPQAKIYVYDNNSTDDTKNTAQRSGAIVKEVPRQGKGHVITVMFRDIDADVYVMVDGDNTYPSEEVHKLLQPVIQSRVDICIGDRLSNGTYFQENKRNFHNFGNLLVRKLINGLFGGGLKDIMSGYRVMNKRFVKSFPIRSGGFEVETEMSIFSLNMKFEIDEIPIQYRDRPAGSFSKLNTFQDGIRVIKTIIKIFKDYKPLLFFSLFSVIFSILGIGLGTPLIIEYLKSGLVPRFPTAILSMGLMILSALSLVSGLILDTIAKNHKEILELHIKSKFF